METSTSLLERLRLSPHDQDAWDRLWSLYQPWICHQLRFRWGLAEADAEDLTQEVLLVVSRELHDFERQRAGSFRKWLRAILYHQSMAFFRKRHGGPPVLWNEQEGLLAELVDDHSELSRQWDEEHNQHVIRRLFELLDEKSGFTPANIQAFRRQVLDGASPGQVAQELGSNTNAVTLAKSRILRWLREQAGELLH